MGSLALMPVFIVLLLSQLQLNTNLLFLYESFYLESFLRIENFL